MTRIMLLLAGSRLLDLDAIEWEEKVLFLSCIITQVAMGPALRVCYGSYDLHMCGAEPSTNHKRCRPVAFLSELAAVWLERVFATSIRLCSPRRAFVKDNITIEKGGF